MSSTLIRPGDLTKSARTKTVRGTYFVQTWGCQMNEEDSEQMGLYLEQIGFARTDNLRAAHIVLLNTCSVRKKPEDKAFSFMGELAEFKRSRPEMVIGVCGCMAQIRADEIHKRAPHIDFVVGTAHIASLPGLVEEALQRHKFQHRLELPERKGSVVTDIPKRHVGRDVKLKAFVPIQYGCDKFCTFCIVPTTRGRERSRPTEDILEEVRALANQGTKEVTLLGQTVNSYGKNLAEGRVPFGELLWKLSEIEGLERIRYTSPYPRDFKTYLIETIRDCPKVMEHVHMPLQSGDNDVLKAMKRLYSTESFIEIIEEVRAKVPRASITTDIIVGFPGETEAQFENTMEMMRRVRFDLAYMFAYSPRPDTPSAEWDDQIPTDEKKRRLNALISQQQRISLEIHESLVGQEFEVLVEGPSTKEPGMLHGYSREFRAVRFPGDLSLRGEMMRVKAVQGHPWGLTAEAI